MESQNRSGWKSPLSSSPTVNPALPSPPLNHGLKHHIYVDFKHLQGWKLESNHPPAAWGSPQLMLSWRLSKGDQGRARGEPTAEQEEGGGGLVQESLNSRVLCTPSAPLLPWPCLHPAPPRPLTGSLSWEPAPHLCMDRVLEERSVQNEWCTQTPWKKQKTEAKLAHFEQGSDTPQHAIIILSDLREPAQLLLGSKGPLSL